MQTGCISSKVECTLPWGRFPLNEARFVALWLDPLDLGRFTEAVTILAAAAVGLFSLTDQKR